MGNIEKYGVLALIFVIVLILAVAICNGPGDPAKSPENKTNPVTDTASSSEVNLRDNVRKVLERQGLEEAKNPGVVVPGGGAAVNPTVDRNPQFKTYTVKKGDTLASIAGAELGSQTRWQEIVKVNEGLDPKRLKVDQALLLPVSTSAGALVNGPKADDKTPIKAAKKSVKSGSAIAKDGK